MINKLIAVQRKMHYPSTPISVELETNRQIVITNTNVMLWHTTHIFLRINSKRHRLFSTLQETTHIGIIET